MPRVIGIDPGTVSIDVCGIDGGRLFLDESYSTRLALTDPAFIVRQLESYAPLDLIVGPSGYGLPLRRARDLTDADIRLWVRLVRYDAGPNAHRTINRATTSAGERMTKVPGLPVNSALA